MRNTVLFFCLALSSWLVAQTTPATGDPIADAQLTKLEQQGWRVESASLSYDGRTLYMSLCRAPRTIYDLYYCKWVNGNWQNPVRINELSTESDEWSPSISSDEQTLYFIRHDVVDPGTRKATSSNDMIYCAKRQDNDHWQQPEWMLISNGKDSRLHIYPDNKLLTFYSTGRDPESNEKKEQPHCYYVQKIDKYNWTLPLPLTGSIAELLTPVKTLTGQVKDHKSGRPMVAHTDVYDALTQQLIAKHITDEKGTFRLALPSGRTYRIEVYQPGYSKTYIRPGNDDKLENKNVELTDELTLNVRVFDDKELSPLSCHMSILDKQTAKTTKKDINHHRTPLQLTIDHDYTLQLSREGYADTTYVFDTKRDVLVTQTDIDLYMRSGLVKASFLATDKETNESVNALFMICPYEPNTGDLGDKKVITTDTLLPCYKLFHLNVTAEGYLFYDTLFYTMRDEGNQSIAIPMIPMKKDAIVQLKNIEFEFNSYLLKEESYDELKRVAELMHQNPSLQIELSAHTDDIGSAEYNLRLSQKRGESVARYLIEEGVAKERLRAKGYGKTRPLVPNTSDANRALNRRVEFTIIEL